MNTQSIDRILRETAYVRTGGSAQEQAKRQAQRGQKAMLLFHTMFLWLSGLDVFMK